MHNQILSHLKLHETPKRKPISSLFPILYKPIVFLRRKVKSIKNILTIKKLEKKSKLPSVLARHSSPLFRKLGDSDMNLQVGKIKNLEIAIKKLDGLVIPDGAIFSFWQNVGSIKSKKGYVDGMLLSNGKVNKGLGGGLCQLSNFLFWIFLHTDVEIVERHHHSVDFFPDSLRTLPFGSGATIFHNYYDLQLKNISGKPLQISLWLTDSQLKGQILSILPSEKKFNIIEKNHCFVKNNDKYYRYNELFRETYTRGEKIKEEKIITNFAPVIYLVTKEYLEGNGYKCVNI